jgi:hypothetical protein
MPGIKGRVQDACTHGTLGCFFLRHVALHTPLFSNTLLPWGRCLSVS